jgi:SAM-dependent methyltransferase
VLFSGVDFSTVKRALDFGCGVGTDLIALARRNAGLQGVGYTISGRQAGIARARIERAGLADRVEVHHRDSASDPFPGLFDLVFGFEVGHHIADKAALFGNLAGHMMPEGTLLLADCAANTVAPIILPEVGSYTSTKDEYAEVLSAHGLAVTECVDLSQEIANFLHDPGLEAMIAEEAARGKGDPALMAAVQRSWDGFGQALRSGLISYLLITARRRPTAVGLAVANRQHLGLS